MSNGRAKKDGPMGSEFIEIELGGGKEPVRTRYKAWVQSPALFGGFAAIAAAASLAPTGAVAVVVCASSLLIAFNFALLGHLTKAYTASQPVDPGRGWVLTSDAR
ncbi:MAG: hypothetical protein CTY20_15620 [Hyphomicrobium sp.]|nr:MAG: hypothetical protein CTY20_15620 [Hyphomicrobium sp.]